MSRDIEILQKGRVIKTLSLENGTYKIGRSPASDLLLSDNAVSKNHASLIIENESFFVRDNGSVNGIYCKGEKISDKEFRGSFQIEIKPFIIRTSPIKGLKKSVAEVATKGFPGLFLLGNIKISVSVLMAIVMFVSLLIIYIPLKNGVQSVKRQEFLRKGILTSRYMAELNRLFMEKGETALVRTSPFNVEDGVLYAFIVDGHGRIIAPHEQQGDFFNWDELPAAFRERKLRVGTGAENERVIFSPILNQDQVLGGAIIGFARESSASGQGSGLGGRVIFLLVILFMLGMAMTYLLSRAFLGPLKQLYEEVEMSIKDGRNQIDFKAPYEELNNLSRAFNRLMLRKDSVSPAPESVNNISISAMDKVSQKTPSPGKPELNQEKKSSSASDKNMQSISNPWCLVNVDDYTIVKLSDNFTENLGLNEFRPGMHIIEAFEAGIIQTVSQILDNKDSDEVEIEIGGKKYLAGRRNDASDESNVLIVFEEKV